MQEEKAVQSWGRKLKKKKLNKDLTITTLRNFSNQPNNIHC